MECVWWTWSIHCDIFSRGRESFCISHTQMGTKCVQCRREAWMHCTYVVTQILQREAGKYSWWWKKWSTKQCFNWWNEMCCVYNSQIWDLLVYKHSIKVSHITVQHVLITDGYTKMCMKCVPKQLTNENEWVYRQNSFEISGTAHMQSDVLSLVMNRRFFTSPRHKKKTLEFGIKKVSHCQKNFVLTIWQNKSSTLHFGIVKVYCPLIFKRGGMKPGWISKNI